MLSLRHEGFRYEFAHPHPCSFELISIDTLQIESHWGSAVLHDLSPHGMNFRTNLNIPVNEKKIGIMVSFTLIEEEIVATGYLMWQKREGGYYSYGVQLDNDEIQERKIVEELKKYVKKHKK